MIREYKTVEEISGPLMMVRMVENVTYDELILNGDPELYLKAVTKKTPLD